MQSRRVGAGLDEYLNGLAAAGRPLDAAVVASQGHYDELALEALLRVPPGYLGLIASRKRGAAVRDLLIEGGARPAAVGGIHNPAGLEIGATTPGDVAVSIMAQIVQCRHTGSANASAQLLAACRHLRGIARTASPQPCSLAYRTSISESGSTNWVDS